MSVHPICLRFAWNDLASARAESLPVRLLLSKVAGRITREELERDDAGRFPFIADGAHALAMDPEVAPLPGMKLDGHLLSPTYSTRES